MGAWGVGHFDNDNAMDWVAELATAKAWSQVEQAFAAVVGDDIEYRDASDCSVALAAAAVLAAAIGRAPAFLPDEVARWVARASPPHAGLPAVGVEVIDAILAESELKDLWEDSDAYAEWQAALGELRSRLAATAS